MRPPRARSWSCVSTADATVPPRKRAARSLGGALAHRRLAAAELLDELPQAAAVVLVVERNVTDAGTGLAAGVRRT